MRFNRFSRWSIALIAGPRRKAGWLVMEDRNQPNKVISFIKRGAKKMSGKTKGRYDNQSIALSAEEKESLEILHIWSGIRPATLARALYYRGIAAFLKDGKLEAPQEQEQLASELDVHISSHPEIKQARQIVRARKEREEAQMSKKKRIA